MRRVHPRRERAGGTTFKAYFPATEQRADPATRQTVGSSSVRGTETILVVDDEEQVLKLLESVLRRNGYRVLAARHPGEAIVLSEQCEEPIDVLITDVMMPQMNGHELAERLLKGRPEMKALYMSGYTEHKTLDRALAGGAAFMQKPMVPAALGRKVRELLGRRSAA